MLNLLRILEANLVAYCNLKREYICQFITYCYIYETAIINDR